MRVILGRIGPAGGELDPRRWASSGAGRLGPGGKGLGHEADLDVGLEPALHVGVEDAVNDRPVVVGPALGVLGVGVGRAPLQGGGAVAGGQQVVRADEDGLAAQAGELGEQLLAVLHISVVRLIVAEEPPGGRQFSLGLAGVDPDGHGGGRCGLSPGGCAGSGQGQ